MPGPNDNFISRTPITAIGASTNVGANVRITAQIETLSSGDRTTIERELAARPVPVQNFATTFAEVRKQGVAKHRSCKLGAARWRHRGVARR